MALDAELLRSALVTLFLVRRRAAAEPREPTPPRV
jgi:hypothetical protein